MTALLLKIVSFISKPFNLLLPPNDAAAAVAIPDKDSSNC